MDGIEGREDEKKEGEGHCGSQALFGQGSAGGGYELGRVQKNE